MSMTMIRFFRRFLKPSLFYLALALTFLAPLAPNAQAASSTANAANPWYGGAGTCCGYNYYTSPAEFAIGLVAANQRQAPSGDHVYLMYFTGPNTTDWSCSTAHPCMRVYYTDTNNTFSGYTDVEYVGSAPFGTVGSDGSYAASGQTPGGKSNGHCSCGRADPIDVGSGNVFVEKTDYETTGQNKLRFVRYYNSRQGYSLASEFGFLWRSNFDRYIQLNSSSSVSVERPDGRQLVFALTGSVWTPDSDVDITLTHSGSTWTLTDHDDTVETYTTNTAGYAAILNSIEARNGYTQTLTYNSSNQLSSVTDSYSRTLTLTYNSSGLLSSIETPDSTTITYGYATAGLGSNLTSVDYPTSPASTLTYTYGNSQLLNALTGITDENGNTYETWTYDSYSRGLTNYQGGSGLSAGLTTITYNDSTGARTVTNALGVTDTYSFSVLQNMPKATGISRAATSNTAAATETFTYDSNGYLASLTDWNGNQTTYANDAHGDPTTINEAVGSSVARTTTISYDSTWVHLPHQITTPGLTTTNTYDGSGQLLTSTGLDTTTTSVPYSTNGQTRTWTFTWSNHLLATSQTPRTDVTATTTFGYSSSGALTSITDALGHVTSITSYTGGGRPLTIVDPNSVTTTLTYDPRQRLTSSAVTTSAGVDTTSYTYDAAGNLTQTTLPDSSYLAYTYDNAHRVTKVTDALTHYIQYTLDALGDITGTGIYNSSTDQRYTHSATYDDLGRLLTDVGASGQTTTYGYDADSNALSIQDPLSHTTAQAFDALNRLSYVTDANSGVTGFGYDAHDRTTGVNNANSAMTSYVYDGFGDVIQQVSPDSGTTVYHYNSYGDLTQKVDALSVTTNYTYDKLDRITSRTYPADSTQNVTYTYDRSGGVYGFGIGRLGTMTDAVGYVNYAYDERGNKTGIRRYNSGGTQLTGLFPAYNSASRLKGYSYPSGLWVGWTFDAAGDVGEVQILPYGSSTYQPVGWVGYYPFGPQKYMTFGNSIGEGLTHDQDYRTTNVTDTAGSTTLRNLTYSLNGNNNVTGITDAVHSANNQSLTYDVLNRIWTANGPYGYYQWGYDAVGNRTFQQLGSATIAYGHTGSSNRLASINPSGGSSITVITNANGNITSIPPANSSSLATFTYNVANRLASVSGSPMSASFVYSGDGTRYSKQDSGYSPDTYTYDLDGNIIEENDNGTITDYIWANGRLLGIFTPATGSLYYVHGDRLGTPQFVTNSSQAVVWSTSYDPFGNTTGTSGSVTQNMRLPGQFQDPETGFNYNLNRDYMPNLGRYLETDPIGLRGGINTYSYANQNPGAFIDPWGLLTEDQLLKLLNAARDWGTSSVPYVYGGKSKAGADCSGSVYGIYQQAGLPYNYVNSRAFATSPDFVVDSDGPQPGDVGVYPGHTVLYDPNAGDGFDVWSASHPGGPDFGPGKSSWYRGAPVWYKYNH